MSGRKARRGASLKAAVAKALLTARAAAEGTPWAPRWALLRAVVAEAERVAAGDGDAGELAALVGDLRELSDRLNHAAVWSTLRAADAVLAAGEGDEAEAREAAADAVAYAGLDGPRQAAGGAR